jgi:hypothetical protein
MFATRTGDTSGRRSLTGRGLHLALGYHIRDVVSKKDFRTHGDRDQESLLVKQSKER